MASSAKQFSLLILLTLFFSLHIQARESQFFSKVPSNNNNNVVEHDQFSNREESTLMNMQQDQQTPEFIPQTEDSYGLYGHETGQLPPSDSSTTTTSTKKFSNKAAQTEEPLNKAYLPDNYNPVAYVTKPEGYKSDPLEAEPQGVNKAYLPKNYNTQAYVTEPQDNMNGANFAQNYNNEAYVTEPQGYKNYANVPKTYNNDPFVTEPQDLNNNNNRFMDRGNNNYYNAGREGRLPVRQQQGMSDTRFMENGKYFYNVNTERYSKNHPYETAKIMDTGNEMNYNENNKNFYGSNENSFDFDNKNYNNNNNKVFYGNKDMNSYEFNNKNYNNNFMQRFQNEEDQFQDNQNDEFP